MSLLVHRCTRCQHPDVWGFSYHGECSYGGCRTCSHGRCTPDPEPVVLLTRHAATGEPNDVLVTPGGRWKTGGNGIKTCDCGRCRQVFAEREGSAGE